MATFGITREMQLDQQALAAAMGEYTQINARYQALLQQVNTQRHCAPAGDAWPARRTR
jgi:hypothetical protein